MYSNLYYLSKLIDKSINFSKFEKLNIFSVVKKNPNKIINLIKIFEDEKKGLDYIRNNYQKNLNILSKNYKKDLLDLIKEKNNNEKKIIKDKVNKMKLLEKNEKISESNNLEYYINKI